VSDLSRLARGLEARRREMPASHPCVVRGERALSYGELFERVDGLGALFARRALSHGDRVLIATEDPAEASALYLASLRCGLVAVPFDARATPEELGAIVRQVEPRLVFADRTAPGRLDTETIAVATRRPSLRERLLGTAVPPSTYPKLLRNVDTAPLPERISEAALGHVLFSSGTTGGPKGVELTHAALFAHARTLARVLDYGASTRILNLLPWHHTDGIAHGPLLLSQVGLTLHRPERPFRVEDAEGVVDTLHRERITHLYLTPTLLGLFLRLVDERALGSRELRLVVCSGDHLPESLWRRFEDRFGVLVVNLYGLTETVSGALYSGPAPETRRVGSLGRPVDCEIRIDPETGDENGVGELLIRGEHLLRGYFRDPDATSRAMDDGWLRTGDLVRCDADGFVRFVGRAKNVIVRGGVKVAPEEIAAVVGSFPGVREAVVIGAPDALWGERVCCFATVGGAAPPSSERILELCRERLGSERRPSEVVVVDELPRVASGKVSAQALRDLLSARGSSDAVAPPSADLESEVLDVAAEALQVRPETLSLASGPEQTHGWDSLGHMRLVEGLEARFGVALRPKDVMRLRTLAEAVRILAALRHHG